MTTISHMAKSVIRFTSTSPSGDNYREGLQKLLKNFDGHAECISETVIYRAKFETLYAHLRVIVVDRNKAMAEYYYCDAEKQSERFNRLSCGDRGKITEVVDPVEGDWYSVGCVCDSDVILRLLDDFLQNPFVLSQSSDWVEFEEIEYD